MIFVLGHNKVLCLLVGGLTLQFDPNANAVQIRSHCIKGRGQSVKWMQILSMFDWEKRGSYLSEEAFANQNYK
jgi:hypothetical protein